MDVQAFDKLWLVICEYAGEEPGKKITHSIFNLMRKVLKIARKSG